MGVNGLLGEFAGSSLGGLGLGSRGDIEAGGADPLEGVLLLLLVLLELRLHVLNFLDDTEGLEYIGDVVESACLRLEVSFVVLLLALGQDLDGLFQSQDHGFGLELVFDLVVTLLGRRR